MDFNPFTVAAIAILSGAFISLAKMYFDSRTKIGPSGSQLARLDERLNRMEQAIDAIAVETERISEAQRFQTRVLAERSGSVDESEGPPAYGSAQPRR